MTTPTGPVVPTERKRGSSAWVRKFLVEERYVSAAHRRNLYRLSAVLIVVGLVAFTFLLVSVVTHTGFERFDRPVEQWFDAQRNRDATGVMTVLAIVFGPVALPIIIAVALVGWIVLSKHLWRPVVLAVGMLTGVALAQILAPIVRHPRPPISLMLLGPDRTFSFPSGHVLGTSDVLLITGFLLASRIRKRWFTVLVIVLALAGIAAQVISRLYLGYHWISDTTGAQALSLVIVGGVIAVDTRRTARVHGEPLTDRNSVVAKDGT